MAIESKRLKNGKWSHSIRLQHNNLIVKETVRGITKSQARIVENELFTKLIKGVYRSLRKTKNPKLKDFAEAYKLGIKGQKSYASASRIIDQLMKTFGDRRLTELTPSDYLTHRGNRIEEVSPSTNNLELRHLRRMFNVAVADEEYTISRNSLAQIKQLRVDPVDNRELLVWEYRRMLNVAPPYFHDIMFFACNVGTRLQETLTLTFKQIHMTDFSAEVELLTNKSGKRQLVPLNNAVVELLQKIAKDQDIDLKQLSVEQKEEAVFLGLHGKPLKGVRKPLAKTFRRAGVEPKDFHTFRHFWTTEMFNAGVNVKTIQKIGRWTDLQTMLRYCHTQKSQENEAVNRLQTHLETESSQALPLKKEYKPAQKLPKWQM